MNISNALRGVPEVLSIEVTTRCNLDCIYCNKKDEIKDISEELLSIVKESEGLFKKIIVCGIGESFLYPHIYDMVNFFKKQKFCIVTNGTLKIDYEKLNQFNNVERLIFSIDAVDINKIRKISRNYNFDNLILNLNSYKEYRKKTSKRIDLILNCTLNEHNLLELSDLVDFAIKYGLNTIHFSLPRGKEEFINENKDEIKELLLLAKKKSLKNGIYFVNPFETCCVYEKCVTPYLSISGNVYACSETLYMDEVLNNLNTTTFEEIWTSEKYNKFIKGDSCKECGFLLNCKNSFK